jgi:hypothetical protein
MNDICLQILVFSFWPGALDALGQALQQQEVPHIFGAGGAALTSAIRQFCDDNASAEALQVGLPVFCSCFC